MMGWWGAAGPRILTRQQQIDTFKAANPYAVGVADDPSSLDIGLKLPNGRIIRAMSLDELRDLQADPAARKEWLEQQVPLSVFLAMAKGNLEDASRLAQSNVESTAQLTSLRSQLKSAQAANAGKAEELRRLLSRRQAVLDRYAPARLARDLAATAAEIDAQSESLAESFCDSDGGPLGGPGLGGTPLGDSVSVYGGASGGGSGSGWGDDSRTVMTMGGGGAGGGGGATSGAHPAVVAAIREFKEEFIALRKRYHMANAKVELLGQQQGMEAR